MDKSNMTDDDLLTEAQAASLLGVRPNTLAVWRTTKRYPLEFVKIGRLVRYRRSACERFIGARTQPSTPVPMERRRLRRWPDRAKGASSDAR